MQTKEFSDYLKRGGRASDVIKQVIKFVQAYEDYLVEQGVDLEHSAEADLSNYVGYIEQNSKGSAKTHLWAIRYYYGFAGNEALRDFAGILREERIQRKPFALKDFMGVDPDHVENLAGAGIRNVTQMLKHGATPEARQRLAEDTGIPVEIILDLVKLSDLARIPGIKGVRARLYVDAGIDSIEKMAKMEPETLRARVIEFIGQTGFPGIPTLPKEAQSGIRKARRLPVIVQF